MPASPRTTSARSSRRARPKEADQAACTRLAYLGAVFPSRWPIARSFPMAPTDSDSASASFPIDSPYARSKWRVLIQAIDLFLAAKAAEGISPKTTIWYRIILARLGPGVRAHSGCRWIDRAGRSEHGCSSSGRPSLRSASLVLGKWLHENWIYAYGSACEPPLLLRGVEEEALAALPGGTGPGALTARPRRRTGASRERRLQGPRHHDGDRGFSLPSEPAEVPPMRVRTTHMQTIDPRRRPPWLGHRRRGRASAANARPLARPAGLRPTRPGGVRRRRRRRSTPRAATRSAPTSRRRSTPASAASSSPRPAGRSTATAVERALRDARRGRGRRRQLQPRRRAVRPARRDGGGAVRRGRRVRSVPRRVASPRRRRDRPSGTALDLARRMAARPPGPGDTRRPRGRLHPGGRLARACTSSASMPSARPSSSG